MLKDIDLYRRIGLGGFHIDRGAGEDDLVAISVKKQFPYYVDHAADKGFLYLTRQDKSAVTKKNWLIVRPRSLADPNTIQQMKDHLKRNITSTKKGTGSGLCI